MLRRLDHIAILVRSTDDALAHFRDRLGLPVVHTESSETPPVRLTYLDCGNALIQLIEPAGPSPLALQLNRDGEGVHHVCFSADDPVEEAAALADGSGDEPLVGSGRGRASAFVAGAPRHNVLIECTEFRPEDDGPAAG